MPATLHELLRDLPAGQDAQLVGCVPATTIEGVQDDSRAVRSGELFVARTGGRVDGHDFVEHVVAAGGIPVVRSDRKVRVEPRVEVTDTDAALPMLAAAAAGWPGRRLWLAGITGTNGKTTVAHMVAAILGAAPIPHVRLGTTGNWLVDGLVPSAFTTPFPIELQGLLARGVARGATHAVLEVSSHALAQGRALPLLFDAVAFTSFSQDHLDFHADMDDYLSAKIRLAQTHLDPRGTAIAAARTDPAARFLQAARDVGARCWTFSPSGSDRIESAALAVTTSLASSTPTTPGQPRVLHTPAGSRPLQLSLPGAFNEDNAMVAAGLCLASGLDLNTVMAGLAAAVVPGRLEPVTAGEGAPRVLVDYAHTPDAVARAARALRADTRGTLWVVVGCGGDRDRGKRPLMAAQALAHGDRLVATSDNPRSEDPDAILDDMLHGLDAGQRARTLREVNRADAIARVIEIADAHDTILIAGKGHETTQTMGDEVIAFDDREQARAALRRRLGVPERS